MIRPWISNWRCALGLHANHRDVWTASGRQGRQCERCYMTWWPYVDDVVVDLRELVDARVVFTCPHDRSETVDLGGHSIQRGGSMGDGYCYTHQTFICLDRFDSRERAAYVGAS